MRYVSFFSGVEMATLAWKQLGWELVAVAEVDPFACAVLAHHYPDVPNLGDVSKVDWTQFRERVDVLIGGSPCQAFSVAGMRQGTADVRGSMIYQFARGVEEIQPEWVVYENVPGLLSIEDGATLTEFISYLTGLGYVVNADIYDAQEFGLAQRRRRVFLICFDLDAGLKKRMTISGEAILQCLAEISLLTLEELAARSKRKSRASMIARLGETASGVLRTSILCGKITARNPMPTSQVGYTELTGQSSGSGTVSDFRDTLSVAGLKQRITLLETLASVRGDSSTIQECLPGLLSRLGEVLGLSKAEQPNSDAAQRSTINGGVKETAIGGSALTLGWSLSTLPSWRAIWDESFSLVSASTTSTATSATTESKIYTCAKALLNIAEFTISSSNLRPLSSSVGSSVSIMLTAVTNCARVYENEAGQGSLLLFGEESGIHDWHNLARAADQARETLGHLGTWADQSQVFPNSESLSGNPPACVAARSRPATGPSRRARRKSIWEQIGEAFRGGVQARPAAIAGAIGAADGKAGADATDAEGGRLIPSVSGTLGGTSPGGGWRFGADEAAAGQLIPSIAGTLNANGKAAGSVTQQDAENDMLVVTPILEPTKRAGKKGSRKDGSGHGMPGDPMFTLQAGAQHGVALAYGGNDTSGPRDIATCLNAKGGGEPDGLRVRDAHRSHSARRRLRCV